MLFQVRKWFLKFSTATLLMALAVPVYADCPKLWIYNQSGIDLTAVWQAIGCAGTYSEGSDDYTTVCDHQDVPGGSVKGYSYNWGTTAQELHVRSIPYSTQYSYYSDPDFFKEGLSNDNAGCSAQYSVIFVGPDSDPYTKYTSHKYDLVAGFMYGTNSNANYQCLQISNTDGLANGNGVQMWDHCNKGDPQRNRLWQYDNRDKRIYNVFDQSYCLHRKTGGEPIEGDPIHLWSCAAGTGENKQWNYDTDGSDNNQIRLAAYPDYCMFRSGAGNGSSIYLSKCDTTNQNGRWTIVWSTNGN